MTTLTVSSLPPLRLVSRQKHEYSGPCPFCGGHHRSDRFRVWLEPGRERYWCRQCSAKGWLTATDNEHIRRTALPAARSSRRRRVDANPAHIPLYRQLYAAVALWGHTNLFEPANPDPLAYLTRRGLTRSTIGTALLGYTLHDPLALVTYLRQDHPDLLPYAEAAGILTHDDTGNLRTHPNLCGSILLPYLAGSDVVDLRTRTFPGKGYKSLPGGYADRGAVYPFGWEALPDPCDTVLLTEGEFKALAVTQAYRDAQISVPALAHPGLSYCRPDWINTLHERGVQTIILAYDSQPRTEKDGVLGLTPEEQWTIRHGLMIEATGIQVRVLRLPLDGAPKADIDAFLLDHRPAVLDRLISLSPRLTDFHASLPRTLLRAVTLPLPGDYPSHRQRPHRIAADAAPAPRTPTPLDVARASIPDLVETHATSGEGFLVLAHPPGTGKGHGTTQGLRAYLQHTAAPGQIVWSAIRKDQIHDQQGLTLIPLHGRNPGNCRMHAETQILSEKGYPVTASLCRRRCPHISSCTYLRQFHQDGDFFTPQPILQATSWWQDTHVLVLDEFAISGLTRTLTLTMDDLQAMHRATTCPHAQTILRWLGQIIGNSLDRTLRGPVLLDALADDARTEGQDWNATLREAIAALPDADDQALLPGLPIHATVQDYQMLPPGHLPTLLTLLAHEYSRRLGGTTYTSRLEARDGRMSLLVRNDHLISQLARADQPKLVLDATASGPLLQAIFPNTPLQIVQPHIAFPNQITQVLRADWAKTTLRGQRREAWYDAVAAHVRPDRPTLVVCTQTCEANLRTALHDRGLSQVAVSHYGALRGSNAYKGYDVLLAQIYHPNLAAIVREGRALFADDATPLDERMITVDRPLRDATGATWHVSVPTFADDRLTALLTSHREAEMVQTALRGRPIDYPDAQITLLFSLPLPDLPPTTVIDQPPSPASNGGRQAAAILALIAAGQQLLSRGHTRIAVADLVQESGLGEVTVRKHWQYLGNQLALATETEQYTGTHQPAHRLYQRAVLVAPVTLTLDQPPSPIMDNTPAMQQGDQTAIECIVPPESTDHADNKISIMRVIHAAECAISGSPDTQHDHHTMPASLPTHLPRGTEPFSGGLLSTWIVQRAESSSAVRPGTVAVAPHDVPSAGPITPHGRVSPAAPAADPPDQPVRIRGPPAVPDERQLRSRHAAGSEAPCVGSGDPSLVCAVRDLVSRWESGGFGRHCYRSCGNAGDLSGPEPTVVSPATSGVHPCSARDAAPAGSGQI